MTCKAFQIAPSMSMVATWLLLKCTKISYFRTLVLSALLPGALFPFPPLGLSSTVISSERPSAPQARKAPHGLSPSTLRGLFSFVLITNAYFYSIMISLSPVLDTVTVFAP